MPSMDQEYIRLASAILDEGALQLNERTGKRTYTLDGAHMRIDMRQGFPATTLKKLAFESVKGEWVGFLRGVTSAADFRALGSKVWDANANQTEAWLTNLFRKGEDDLGPIYGAQWRRWPAYKLLDREPVEIDIQVANTGWTRLGDVGENKSIHVDDFEKVGDLYYKEIDQLADCLTKLIKNPSDRRILFHGWNPAVLDQVALPACHILYQFLPNIQTRELSLCMYIRSNDIPLGNPFNVAEGGLFLHLFSLLCGYIPKTLNIFIGDAHIYEDQVDGMREIVNRHPYQSPRLLIDACVKGYDKDASADENVKNAIAQLDKVKPSDFMLTNYQHHDAVTMPFAK